MAVRSTDPPSQKVVEPLVVNCATGGGGENTVWLADESPQAVDTVTAYAPPEVTVISAVLAPVDHAYESPPLAVNVTEAPLHNVSGPAAEMLGNGPASTVKVI